jgi:hypothetical protein
VEPSSPDIVGYVHVENSGTLGEAVQPLLGAVGFAPDALRTALAATVGDLRMTLLPRDASVTVAWVQSPGDAGPAKRIVVLPPIASEEAVYLADCMARTKQTCTVLQGLSFIGPVGGAARIESLAGPLRDLHQATHATEISCYFRAPMLAENRDAILRALTAIHPSEPASLLRASPLPLSAAAANGAGADLRPVALPGVAGNQDLARILDVLLQDLDSAHIAVSPAQSPLRLAVNLTARPGTPLAKFLSVKAPEANPLVGFVPSDGFLRVALSLDSVEGKKLASDVLARSFPASGLQAARGSELTELAGALFGLGDQSALTVRPAKADGSPSWLFVTTPRDAAGASQGLQVLAERSDLLSGALKGAPGAAAAPAAGSPGSLLPVMPGATPGSSSPIHRTLLVAPSAEIFEKFPVGRMDDAAAASGASAGAAPLLLFCPTGPRFVAASDRDSLVESINRVLRLVPVWPALLSQKTFVAGGNLYLDLRPAAQSDKPWSESSPPIEMTARLAGGCGQVVASIPFEMLGLSAAPAVPAAPAAPAGLVPPAAPVGLAPPATPAAPLPAAR